ncbi:hypothetical protein TRVA0_014S02542 [Trichomonascus vanleenenianus]|uniref:Zn(II)2Cys6 transcription factor n=1 Tax=Trichomonascus vanleenenianus TaxID=2268995 RepID=UPI003ECA3EC5
MPPVGSAGKATQRQRIRNATPVATKACKECQKRKGRCSGGSPCGYCLKTSKPCLYEDRPARLPLTRRNLDLLERKCAKLENILRTLHPDLDLTAILDQDRCTNLGGLTADMGGLTTNLARSTVEDDPEDPQQLLEWHEDTSGRDALEGYQDGTAMLDLSTYDTGYLGKSSGVSLLKVVHKLLNINEDEITAPLSTGMESDNSDYNEYMTHTINHAESQLAVKAVRDRIVDSYFIKYNICYPILHEYSFRQQYERMDELPETSNFHTLLRMVVAMGTLCARTRANSDDYCFYLSARSRISANMLESGTVEQIQILLLMSNYLQKRDKPNTGYNFLGLAGRMAIGTGLHIELNANDKRKHTVGDEIRRRLWWTLHLFDSGSSMTFGRPPMMADRAVEVKVPLNIDDKNMAAGDPVPVPVMHATPYTAVISYAKLSIIFSRMFERFFLRRRPLNSAMDLTDYMYLIESFDSQLTQWRNELPPDFYSADCPAWFIGPRAICLWRERYLRMLMYKRVLEEISMGHLQGNIPKKYLPQCLSAAISTVQGVKDYSEKGPDQLWWGVTWYATYYLFQSNLFIILIILIIHQYGLIEEYSTELKDAYSALDVSNTLFPILQESNPVARKCISSLSKIHSFIAVRLTPSMPTPIPGVELDTDIASIFKNSPIELSPDALQSAFNAFFPGDNFDSFTIDEDLFKTPY